MGDLPPLSNSNCDGMRVKTRWDAVQVAPALPVDFSRLDEATNVASSHGKFIGLSINAGGFCPDWLWNLGAHYYTLTEGRAAGEKIPLPGDTVFLSHWKKVIKDFGARYDANPTVAYVVLAGIGNHDEWNLCQGPSDSVALEFNNGASKWIAQTKEIITCYANAFPHTAIMGALQTPFYYATGRAALLEVVTWAVAKYPRHFGVSNNGLNPNSNTGYLPNQLVRDNASTQPTGFQEATSLPNGRDLLNSLFAAIGLGGRYVEVYPDDMTNDALQSDINEGRAILLSLKA